jgi:hypothetical protein
MSAKKCKNQSLFSIVAIPDLPSLRYDGPEKNLML